MLPLRYIFYKTYITNKIYILHNNRNKQRKQANKKRKKPNEIGKKKKKKNLKISPLLSNDIKPLCLMAYITK
jgi:hypothetical protein